MLPKASPRARSTSPTILTAEISVAISGMDVATAKNSIPTKVLPSPVLSAMVSEYLVSLVPAIMIMAAHAMNLTHTQISNKHLEFTSKLTAS